MTNTVVDVDRKTNGKLNKQTQVNERKIISLLFLCFFVFIGTGNAQMTYNIFVDGNCSICQDRIETTAQAVAGVDESKYFVDTKTLTVKVQDDKFDFFELHDKIAEAGHDTNLREAKVDSYADLPETCKYRKGDEQSLNLVSILVDGNCGMCKSTIESAANRTNGVKAADWDSEALKLTVEIDPNSFEVESLHRNIAAAGYDTDQVKAEDKVYEELAACCKYREEHQGDNEALKGFVVEGLADGTNEPLIGANLYWLSTGEGTVTDENGSFHLDIPEEADMLVVSYVGYRSDTINILKSGHVEIYLDQSVLMDAIEVAKRNTSTSISYINPIKVQSISKKELTKAACCNLSESFETTPSVDVSFADAVTGVKTIQMLGLASPYIQISRELMPDVRGLAAIYGMEYTPGPWIDKIDLVQGAGSVQNGFESIAGQINVGYYKPSSEEKLYLNVYANQGGRYEANALTNMAVGKKAKTALLFHTSTRNQINDVNNDGFIDMPLDNKLIVANRWAYSLGSGWRGQAGGKYTTHNHSAGEISALEDDPRGWGANFDASRVEGWIKQGKVFSDDVTSVGIQIAASNHQQDARFGDRNYKADHTNLYANLLGTRILSDEGDQVAIGLSMMYDDQEDVIFDQLVSEPVVWDRKDIVPGVFVEYTEKIGEQVTIVGGLRADYHNEFGLFTTQRLHMKYSPSEYSAFRISAGNGFKRNNIYAENIGLLSSNRTFSQLLTSTQQTLAPERAWNFGANYSQEFVINSRDLTINMDYYHTFFTDKTVVDLDESATHVYYYDLDGRAFSNSIQAMVGYNIAKGLDVKVAYRMNDVQTEFQGSNRGLRENPLIAKHRWFANAAYESDGGWKFDYTINRIGAKRLPDTQGSPTEFQLDEYSPAYFVSNAQIAKTFGEKFEVYLGGENIMNFRQENPIVSAEDPTSQFFDGSMAWGPIFGRNIYVGARYKIFNSEEYTNDIFCQ